MVPAKVVSNAKLLSSFPYYTISRSISLPADTAAAEGSNGESPSAIRSALMNTGQSASYDKNSRAKVVLPVPLGPAIISTLGF